MVAALLVASFLGFGLVVGVLPWRLALVFTQDTRQPASSPRGAATDDDLAANDPASAAYYHA